MLLKAFPKFYGATMYWHQYMQFKIQNAHNSGLVLVNLSRNILLMYAMLGTLGHFSKSQEHTNSENNNVFCIPVLELVPHV